MNEHISRYIGMVESGELNACREQHAMIAMVRRAFDSEDIVMTEQSYYEARLGRCKLNGNTRINYWPVILGTASIAHGNHRVEIKGLGRNINIGGIYIFDNSTAGGQNGFEA